MTDEQWIIVPNWDRFQHYKNRNPTWIKVHLELFSRDNYLELAPTARALLHGVWALYAQHAGVLRAGHVQGALNMRASREHWEALTQAGFVELSASKPLALTRVRAVAREVLRTSKESASAAEPASGAALALEERARQVAAAWNGGSSDEFDEALDRLERDLHRRIPYTLRETLWDEALHRQDGLP